jgi:hypothetical protein
MRLLISDIRPVDAVLDRAIPWTDDLADALELRPEDGEAPDGEELLEPGRRHHWYEPRLSALRRLIADQQSWEIR